MTINEMYRKSRKTIDKLMFKHGFFAKNIIENPVGMIVEYIGQFDEAYLVVFNEKGRAVNVM